MPLLFCACRRDKTRKSPVLHSPQPVKIKQFATVVQAPIDYPSSGNKVTDKIGRTKSSGDFSPDDVTMKLTQPQQLDLHDRKSLISANSSIINSATTTAKIPVLTKQTAISPVNTVTGGMATDAPSMIMLVEGLEGDVPVVYTQLSRQSYDKSPTLYATNISQRTTGSNRLLKKAVLTNATSMYPAASRSSTGSSSVASSPSPQPQQYNVIKRIGLFGICDSGKSTLLKQLRIHYGQGITEREKRVSRFTLVDGLLRVTQAVLKQMNGMEDRETEWSAVKERLLQCEGAEDLMPANIYYTNDGSYTNDYSSRSSSSSDDDYKDTPKDGKDKLLESMRNLCKDQQFLESAMKLLASERYESECSVQQPDIARYLLDNSDRLLLQLDATDLDGTTADALMSRIPTLGAVEAIFPLTGDIAIKVCDFGGYRHLRAKLWSQEVNGTEPFNVVVYMHSLANYNLAVEEDPASSQLEESLTVFEQLANTEELLRIPMILVLNKLDAFQAKLERRLFPATSYSPNSEDEGEQDQKQSIMDYLKQRFTRAVHKKRQLYLYITSVTDCEQARLLLKQIVSISMATAKKTTKCS